ncbi:hypothetical protein [[Mycobacterium] wendilense]|uniref:Uncharacterized protein n=1 Tax=[Mycobacterium] wendilense TaxID=3064284 RepID=A0ABM9M7S7_9MYCO|nr:hypothetical protein [Mycolicibacterium sp. MU0050]CAJ1578300.1 hypothetical protein MU0050_000013 [Mycolicibacterium sp. MU0050]
MTEGRPGDDEPETTVDSAPNAETEFAALPAADTASRLAWELDDGPEWKPPFWTPGKITVVAVAIAVVAAVAVAGFAGYHLRGGSEPSPSQASRAPLATATVPATASPLPREAEPPPAPPPPVPRPTTPRGPVDLAAPRGTTFVGTQSGRTSCQLTAGSVACLVDFVVDTPRRYGAPANGAQISINGDFEWILGDAGQQQLERLAYGVTYRALGWTIKPTSEGTTFINDTTGHGMTVSVEGVQPF